MTSTHAQPRPYRSVRREQQARQTRADLLDAAKRLFHANGWTATGMRDIAREAGVATETVYAHFPSKSALFQAAIDIAVVGDDAAVPLAERREFAALGEGSRAERLAAAGRLVAATNGRTARFAEVIREAAAADQAMAAALRATRERQRADVAAGAALLLGRLPTGSECDAFFALVSPEVYQLLVQVCGWSPAHYTNWIASALGAILSDEPRTS